MKCGPVRVMGAGMPVWLCVKEVCLCVCVCVIICTNHEVVDNVCRPEYRESLQV